MFNTVQSICKDYVKYKYCNVEWHSSSESGFYSVQ